MPAPRVPAAGTPGWADDIEAFYSAFSDPTNGHLMGPVLNVKSPEFGAAGNGVTDDTAAIQAVFDAVPSTAGRVLFPSGVFGVEAGALTIHDKENVYLVGAGAQKMIYQAGISKGTVLKALGGSGVLLDFGATASSAQWIRGGGLRGMALDGGGFADTCLKLTSIYGGRWIDFHLEDATSQALMTTTVNLAGTEDCQDNVFESFTIATVANAAAKGIVMTSAAAGGGNSSHNVFRTGLIYTQNGTGLEVGDADNNSFEHLHFNRSGTAIAIDLLATNSGSGSGFARYNQFRHCDTSSGTVVARATGFTQPSGPNDYQYTLDNASPFPTTELGADLTVSYI